MSSDEENSTTYSPVTVSHSINSDQHIALVDNAENDGDVEVPLQRRIDWSKEATNYAKNFIPPIIYWIREYSLQKFRGDLIAGITVGVLLIPQGMAYAVLAGLPPIYGLYAAFVPPLVYAFLGSSMQLTIGPVAVTAILTESAVVSMGFEPGTSEYNGAAAALALAVGLILLGMGFLNIGFIVNFFSHTVLSAFISAAAIIIFASQIKDLLGIPVPHTEGFIEILVNTFSRIKHSSWIVALGSFICFTILLGCKKIKYIPKWVPIELLVMIAGMLIGWATPLPLPKVGHVPSGLPRPTLPPLTSVPLSSLFVQASVVAVVSYIGSIALAKTFAFRHNYEINATQELVAQGCASIVASFFLGHPVSASFSRTSVNDEMGAQSPFASVITGALVALFLLFLTPVFQYLPDLVLACIVVLSVRSLIDYKEFFYLWKTDKVELFVFILTFLSTLLLGVSNGIFFSIFISLFMVIFRSSRPSIVSLGLTESGVFRNIQRFPRAVTFPGVVILRVEADLFFGNISRFKDSIYSILKENSDTRILIVDGASFNHVDTSALHVLESLYTDLAARSVMMEILNTRGPVRDILRKSGLAAKQTLDPKLTLNEAIKSLDIET